MKKTVTKDYLAEKINKELGLPKSESLELVSSLFVTMTENLNNEDIVKIAGFGTFKVRKKNKRMGRNPKTGI
ncbi:MAG: Integration host factor subunit alpha, partial [Alphaproteobacteria bacterium MarineAlpha9_Bin1]